MAYSPTTWEDGDVISATALNKMEQGIAANSPVLVVTVSTVSNARTMSHTFTQIYEAMDAGKMVYVKESSGSLSGTTADLWFSPVLRAYKASASAYRLYVASTKSVTVSSYTNVHTSAVAVFQASSATANPTFYRYIYPSSNSNSA